MYEAPARIVQTGDHAANFSLKDQHERTFDLLEHMGERVLLSFHPLAWTDYCAEQMKSLEENRSTLESLATTAVGISIDSYVCKRAWARQIGVSETPLLADFWPHGAVARMYGLFREFNGFSERANVIVDESQKVARVWVYPIHSVPDIGEVIRVLEGLGR